MVKFDSSIPKIRLQLREPRKFYPEEMPQATRGMSSMTNKSNSCHQFQRKYKYQEENLSLETCHYPKLKMASNSGQWNVKNKFNVNHLIQYNCKSYMDNMQQKYRKKQISHSYMFQVPERPKILWTHHIKCKDSVILSNNVIIRTVIRQHFNFIY